MTRRIRPADLPILTETVGGDPLELPTFTGTLGTVQSQQLAETLFPLLEAKLLEAINTTPDWPSAMRQVREALPDLIRQSSRKAR